MIVITKRNWTEWYARSPWLNGASILIGAYLWVAHWPFG